MHAFVSQAGQEVVQDGHCVLRSTAETGGSTEDGELQLAPGATRQLQSPDQARNRSSEHEGGQLRIWIRLKCVLC